MHPEIISATFSLVGEILIAYTVIRVHHRFLTEHRIDERVFRIMKREQLIAVFGIILLVSGYILKIVVNV